MHECVHECMPRMRVHTALGSRATNPSPSRRVAEVSHGCVFCLFVLPQACAQDQTYAGYAQYSTFVGYSWLAGIASTCGHPASTVKVTPPALDTCEGAVFKFESLTSKTPCGSEKGVMCGSGATDSECMHCTSSDQEKCNSDHCRWNEAAVAKEDGSNVYDGQILKCEPTPSEEDPMVQTPDSCGNAECAAFISSIDDDALANMKTGLQV